MAVYTEMDSCATEMALMKVKNDWPMLRCCQHYSIVKCRGITCMSIYCCLILCLSRIDALVPLTLSWLLFPPHLFLSLHPPPSPPTSVSSLLSTCPSSSTLSLFSLTLSSAPRSLCSLRTMGSTWQVSKTSFRSTHSQRLMWLQWQREWKPSTLRRSDLFFRVSEQKQVAVNAH